MRASAAHHKLRAAPWFFEHKIIAACQLSSQLGQLAPQCPRKGHDSLPPGVVGRENLADLITVYTHVLITSGRGVGLVVAVSDVLGMW